MIHTLLFGLFPMLQKLLLRIIVSHEVYFLFIIQWPNWPGLINNNNNKKIIYLFIFKLKHVTSYLCTYSLYL